jgi:hypothetical protein
MRVLISLLVLPLAVTMSSITGAQSAAQPPILPPDAVGLEGRPAVRVETTPEGTTRRTLGEREAGEARLSIRMKNGRYYWEDEPTRPLLMREAGEFTYLSGPEPGRYVRFTRINDRLQYVEHIDHELGSVTYWGELRVVLGR